MIDVRIDGPVLVATLGRNAQNTIDDALVDALDAVLAEAERCGVALIHLRSSTANFCGGADPSRVQQWLDPDGVEAIDADGARWSRLFAAIEAFPAIVLAEMRGNALGAGLGLALACDLRIASATARIGVPEVRVGLLPAGMTVERLVRAVGEVAAQRLLIAGELIDGTEAHAMGMMHWVCDDDALEARAAEIAQRVAKQPAAALWAAKRVIAASSQARARGQARGEGSGKGSSKEWGRGNGEGSAEVERDAFHAMLADPDGRSRIEALLARLAAREGA